MRAVCCDAGFAPARPSPRRLEALGVDGVRLVLKDDPAFWSYASVLRRSGLRLAVVLARESAWVADYGTVACHVVIIGNEPNADPTSESSWVMPPDEYLRLWDEYAHRFQVRDLWIGGLLGEPGYLDSILHKLQPQPAGIDLHYSSSEEQLIRWEQAYGLPLAQFEWSWVGVPQANVIAWERVLEAHTQHSAWYAYSRAQGGAESMGLVSKSGHRLKAWHNYHAALS